MTDSLLLGIDLGAGSMKATLIKPTGEVVAEHSVPVTTNSPRSGWSEQDPAEWWQAVCTVTRRVLDAEGVVPVGVAALSVSAGAHTQVLEDADGRVIRPAILWNDQRAVQETNDLRAMADDHILEISGNRANPTWTLPQMLWLARHEPESFARVRRLYVAKDWIRSRLTEDWFTDKIDAAGTLMSTADGASWSQELCDMIGWSVATLPPIADCTDRVGQVSASASAATGLVQGTPVICGTSDTAAETYGAGMAREGLGVIKLATAATVSMLSPHPRPDRTVINYPHVMPDMFYTIAGTNSCASAHKWLRDTFFMRSGDVGHQVFADMDALAARVAPGAEGLFFHPYLNGERSPHWDPLLRAEFAGIGFNHGAGHFVRALYEGIAYSLRDCLDSLRNKELDFSTARLIGGGAASALWQQVVADVVNVKIEIPENGDASFGAALIAGVGIGAFSDEADAGRAVRVKAELSPDPERAAFYARAHEIYVDLHKALAPINHRISALLADESSPVMEGAR
ncbi:xylulokinase [Hoeflea sp. TYP-13]|uniref:xylulokinase n=1 Tax=Hoeflea sp. TYP-13 TaxID=3230023 RepID=UPI0034C64271